MDKKLIEELKKARNSVRQLYSDREKEFVKEALELGYKPTEIAIAGKKSGYFHGRTHHGVRQFVEKLLLRGEHDKG